MNPFPVKTSTKIQVIIAGYPKSGNTWLTRLTAELLEAPVVGFWLSQAADEIAIEGRDRCSTYECYKSHHSYQELLGNNSGEQRKVIHMIRDPRDIVLSGADYFLFERSYLLALKAILAPLPKGERAYYLIQTALAQSPIHPALYRLGLAQRVEQMLDTVLEGNANTHDWCRLSWRDYVEPYLAADHFSVQYETLLDDPVGECNRILHYLGVERTDQAIVEAIKLQSFGVVKAKFERLGEQQKASFLRKGEKAGWRHELSTEQIKKLTKQLGDLLVEMGY